MASVAYIVANWRGHFWDYRHPEFADDWLGTGLDSIISDKVPTDVTECLIGLSTVPLDQVDGALKCVGLHQYIDDATQRILKIQVHILNLLKGEKPVLYYSIHPLDDLRAHEALHDLVTVMKPHVENMMPHVRDTYTQCAALNKELTNDD